MRLGSSLSGVFRVYHGTNAEFKRFSLDFAARPGMAGNGYLGVWVGATNDVAKSFGANCLIVHMEVRLAYRMSVGELAAMNRHCTSRVFETDTESAAYERTFYTQFRQKLLAEGYDCIYVVESDDSVGMGICLDPRNLHIAHVLRSAA